MSFFLFARVFRGPVLLNGVYSVAFLPERVSRCGIASKKVERSIRRPAAPFALFASEHYQSTKNENPDSKPQEVFSLLAKKWKNLPEDEKEGYKSDFGEKLADFKAPLHKIPRRPATAFANFVRDSYAAVESDNPGASAPTVIRIIADKWKEVSADEKEALKEAYLEEKRLYDQRVVEFEENLSEDEVEFLDHVKGEKMQKLRKARLKLLNFPKRPASSFALFLNMEKDRYPRSSDELVTRWVKRMAGIWREMSDDEKELYRQERKKVVEEYEDNVVHWESKHKK